MNKRAVVLAAAVFLVAAFAAAADVTLNVQERVLANGMKILMIPKPGVPRVVCHIYFKVGSINERPGITGSAHVHEHLMFKGTEVMGVTDYAKDSEIDRRIDELMGRIYREKYWKTDGDQARIAAWQTEVDGLVKAEKAFIVKDDLWTQYMKNGGTGLNASTSQETTGYYVTLPSNKIELQMLMESDRMMNARFREFYSEKDVIMEERRLSENQPGYLFSEQVDAAFYAASPYHWDVIGWMDDLRKMTKEDLVAFHNTYYVPNNAVAIYVGDFDPQAVAAMAEKYFGRIPKGPDLEPIRTGEPPQYSEKRLYGSGPAPTSLQMMFHTPRDGDPDAPALSVLASALGSGGGFRGGMGGGSGTGRLYKTLVRDKQLAVSASAMSRPQWYVGVFQFRATPRLDKAVKPEDLEKEIWAEIDAIKAGGLTEAEIQKAKNQSEAMFVRSLASAMGLASRVGRAELMRGWRAILADLEALKKVTNDDIKRVAARYFVKDNSLTAVYTRKSGR
ncbi:MAG TPA: pitrilysin family protein [Candidatus Aminicenantes bacterium]|nr:pitrilysin family protein [Candidatus Aminicenantes bacterium]HRY64215.1 pitrilysin family protein [Candidatus Aminicenantes bacterium]HRZ71128.1 pitrilysin family protein [Candidatus Aminicenantes bacterium]